MVAVLAPALVNRAALSQTSAQTRTLTHTHTHTEPYTVGRIMFGVLFRNEQEIFLPPTSHFVTSPRFEKFIDCLNWSCALPCLTCCRWSCDECLWLFFCLLSPSLHSLRSSRQSSAETLKRSVCSYTSLKTSMLWWGSTHAHGLHLNTSDKHFPSALTAFEHQASLK